MMVPSQTHRQIRLMVIFLSLRISGAFVHTRRRHRQTLQYVKPSTSYDVATSETLENCRKEKRDELKRSLLSYFARKSFGADPVFACPSTKAPLRLEKISDRPIVGGVRSSGSRVSLVTEDGSKAYHGSTDTYYDLLNRPVTDTDYGTQQLVSEVIDSLRVFVPPPLRSLTSNGDYIPMRDLFTSPAVSFAYERGWRQGFERAGFPGPEEEAEMVKNFFHESLDSNLGVVVDMSCATGLFTRRLAKSGEYARVIGCDYSESMLREARRRISADKDLSINKGINASKTKLELIRCDVANIPMQDNSLNALHAGAAMHCWPELQEGLNEIYRVLKPGGRYFASTFLSTYFSNLQVNDGKNENPSLQAFNYFTSTEMLKKMILSAGFEEDKVEIEVLGQACVIIKAIK